MLAPACSPAVTNVPHRQTIHNAVSSLEKAKVSKEISEGQRKKGKGREEKIRKEKSRDQRERRGERRGRGSEEGRKELVFLFFFTYKLDAMIDHRLL